MRQVGGLSRGYGGGGKRMCKTPGCTLLEYHTGLCTSQLVSGSRVRKPSALKRGGELSMWSTSRGGRGGGRGRGQSMRGGAFGGRAADGAVPASARAMGGASDAAVLVDAWGQPVTAAKRGGVMPGGPGKRVRDTNDPLASKKPKPHRRWARAHAACWGRGDGMGRWDGAVQAWERVQG